MRVMTLTRAHMVLLASACSDLTVSRVSAPTAPPTFTPPQIITGPYTLSGAVSERTANGIRPIESASINAWIQQGRFGYSYWWAHGPTVSDAGGGYQLPSLPDGAAGWLQVGKDGYVQQCATLISGLHGDMKLDVQLVATANLSASPSSVPLPSPGFRIVSGTILEMTSAGQQPVAGAFVDYEPVMDFPAAWTISDAGGHYLLCGVLEGETVYINAWLGTTHGWVSVPPGRSMGADIVISE
jgi:hypothetical protein